jgi:dTDP-4-dehydrorhamnose 3,5-epimerase
MAQFEYKVTELYDPDDEIGVIWNDPALAIDWPVERPFLSAKDSSLPRLSEVIRLLPEGPSIPRVD